MWGYKLLAIKMETPLLNGGLRHSVEGLYYSRLKCLPSRQLRGRKSTLVRGWVRLFAGHIDSFSRIQSKNDEKKTAVIHRWLLPLEIPKWCHSEGYIEISSSQIGGSNLRYSPTAVSIYVGL